MEGNEHSLVPQWLKRSRVAGSQLTSPPSSDHITCDGYERTRKGSGISRSYSSVRGWPDREWEKDFDDVFDKDKLFRRKYNRNHSDSVDSILSNRFEKDLLLRSQSMNSGSGKWRETRSRRTSGDRSNPQGNPAESNDMVTGVVGIKDKSLFEEEFPLLGAEDKHSSSDGRVLSSSSSNCTPPTRTSSEISSNDLSSTSDEVRMTVGSSSMALMMRQHTDLAKTTSITPGTMSLSMAETLAQGPSRSETLPQLSIGTQKPEELALKQSRLLIPMMPLSPRSLVASPSEKSRVKTGQQQYPFSYSRLPSHSSHSAFGNSDVQKTISGNSRNVSTSQELNGFSSAAKDNSSPSRVICPTGATASTSISYPYNSSGDSSIPSAWMTLEKRPTFQTQSRSDFFKNLSKKSSSKNSCSDVCPNGISCALEKSELGKSTATSSVSSLAESSSVITENAAAAAASKPLKFSSNGEQQHSTNPVLHPDEEIAFLRSLGWEESAGEDEGLTEDEIQDFYEKYLKLQPSSNISLRSTSKPDSVGT
ncbi:uncharacterized protein LOC130969279 isoform X1 [Arachis stenosperma]|uniref:uncharacterized protein LOC130969279 isoform X1 n=2 Tax=Arachis stenosperma TaxID=217475 RepID=UPI0025ABE8DA|nr:uncharacterized protein LOC130969279 isoform X1 [Arachis stenosperma]